jgi:hypothetical protein
VDLPAASLLESNPYENMGIMQNRILNIYIDAGGPDRVKAKLINGDSVLMNKFLQISKNPEIGSALKSSLVSDSFYNAINTVAQRVVTSAKTNKDLFNHLNLQAGNKKKLVAIHSAYEKMKANQDSYQEISIFLNKKITEILKESKTLSGDQTGMLVYLTILKHTNYYWGNFGI